MVVFTCCHCSESLKKKEVEKHYQFSCRGYTPALTCVDCLKDFNGDAYVAHTSCVTEQERYSAKGYVSKPPSCKGKAKQDNWIQFVQSVLNSNVEMDGYVKKVLEFATRGSSIPRKKDKFINFCKNGFGFKHSPDVYESAWQFLDEKRKEHEKNNSASENNNTDSNQTEVENVAQEDRKRKRVDSLNMSVLNGNGIISEDSGSSGKKKKKQRREKHETKTDELQNDEQVVHTGFKGESKKVKKKKTKLIQNGHEQNNEVSVEENIANENEDVEEVFSTNSQNGGEVIPDKRMCENIKNAETIPLSKKEKKERRKREKYERQLLEIQSVPLPNDDAKDQLDNKSEITEKSKKKKKNQQENLNVDNTEHAVEDKSKVHKKKKHQNLNDEVNENVEPEREQEEEVSEVKTSSKFNWEETVVKLLESKGEMPLKRVEKKVVNEFMNSGVHVESIEKAIAKFNKKILKMSRVKVKKDMVKLVP